MQNRHALRAILLALIAVMTGCGRAEEPKAEAKAYLLPTLSGRVDMTPPGGGYVPPRNIDADRLFEAVVRCYPAPSWFRGELSAVARMGTGNVADLTDTYITGGRTYLGLVAKVPLFSTAETDRERERESARRVKIAEAVAKLHEAVVLKAVAVRKRALYQSLESRAALRVRYGIAETSEQASYLEKLAIQEEAIAKADAEITSARLTLRGMCQSDKAEAVDRLIADMLAP